MAQILNKKQLKNELLQGRASISFTESPKKSETKSEQPQTIKTQQHVGKELKSTVMHIAVIALLFVLAITIDSRFPYLEQFGDKIYNYLRLG
ncbi:hypothetical protein HY844_01780 [Candidatus Berkelbacteria bacterium]|nr:hypothetical protein [Candidatus Berkelbacteria bacterium]